MKRAWENPQDLNRDYPETNPSYSGHRGDSNLGPTDYESAPLTTWPHWPLLLLNFTLRTVLTFVTAQTFCASRDTRVSYGWWLLI